MFSQQRLFFSGSAEQVHTHLFKKLRRPPPDCNHEIICAQQWIPEYADQTMGACGVFKSDALYTG